MFFGVALAGPTVVTHGSDEMVDRLLRPMFTGEHVWCQLFSEPGAGSDLASLACKATRDGDEWIVSGQKVWNTVAHLAHYGLLVTRTDPDVPKHRGMTYFAVDMHADGVDVRPLRQITGESEFNEVYLTDVRIPDADRIGDEGDGWRVSMTTLMNERTTIGAGSGAPARGTGPIAEAVRLWGDDPERSAATKDRLMKLWIDAEVLRLTNIRAGAEPSGGQPGARGLDRQAGLRRDQQGHLRVLRRPPGCPRSDRSRLPEQAVRRDRADRTARGVAARCSCGPGPTRSRAARPRSSATSSASGCSGLPGEPRTDKELPWKDVPRS